MQAITLLEQARRVLSHEAQRVEANIKRDSPSLEEMYSNTSPSLYRNRYRISYFDNYGSLLRFLENEPPQRVNALFKEMILQEQSEQEQNLASIVPTAEA